MNVPPDGTPTPRSPLGPRGVWRRTSRQLQLDDTIERFDTLRVGMLCMLEAAVLAALEVSERPACDPPVLSRVPVTRTLWLTCLLRSVDASALSAYEVPDVELAADADGDVLEGLVELGLEGLDELGLALDALCPAPLSICAFVSTYSAPRLLLEPAVLPGAVDDGEPLELAEPAPDARVRQPVTVIVPASDARCDDRDGSLDGVWGVWAVSARPAMATAPQVANVNFLMISASSSARVVEFVAAGS
jgi:hypothetical protein